MHAVAHRHNTVKRSLCAGMVGICSHVNVTAVIFVCYYHTVQIALKRQHHLTQDDYFWYVAKYTLCIYI
jgi:hypothetical protein